MTEPFGNEGWREDAWRVRPAPVEKERLRRVLADPAMADEAALEQTLTEALARLPEPAIPSNFTARVLQAVKADARPVRRRSNAFDWVRRWLPRAGFACMVFAAGFIAVDRYQDTRNTRLAEGVVAISSAVPSPEILKDFDAICALSTTPPADEQLLAILE